MEVPMLITNGGETVTIRDELCRIIRLNELERCIDASEGLAQLDGKYSERVIPGLIDCLKDGNPDIRRWAVRLLAAARPRSNMAVPHLIELLHDEDWLVTVCLMTLIGDFGALAVAAIPYVEPWIESPNEYLRVLAATTILKIDPLRTEFLPLIQRAAESEHPVAQSLAQEFLDLMQD